MAKKAFPNSTKGHKNSNKLASSPNQGSKAIAKIDRSNNSKKQNTHRLESTRTSQLYSKTPCPSQDSSSSSLQAKLQTGLSYEERLMEQEEKENTSPTKEAKEVKKCKDTSSTATVPTAPSTNSKSAIYTSASRAKGTATTGPPAPALNSPPIDSVDPSDFTSIEEWNKRVNEEFNSIYQDLCKTNSLQLVDQVTKSETRKIATTTTTTTSTTTTTTTSTSTKSPCSVAKGKVVKEQFDCQTEPKMNVNCEDFRRLNFNRSPQPWLPECKWSSGIGVNKSATCNSAKGASEGRSVIHQIELTDCKAQPPPVPPKPSAWPPSAVASVHLPSSQVPAVIVTDVTNKSKIEKIDTIEKTEQLFDENFNQIYNEAVNLANSPSSGRRGNLHPLAE